jgi:hypothetical protein
VHVPYTGKWEQFGLLRGAVNLMHIHLCNATFSDASRNSINRPPSYDMPIRGYPSGQPCVSSPLYSVHSRLFLNGVDNVVRLAAQVLQCIADILSTSPREPILGPAVLSIIYIVSLLLLILDLALELHARRRKDAQAPKIPHDRP